jgi:dihydropteroate synthase
VARSSSSLQKLARRMVDEGAAVLDLGAMSTAPYVRGAIGEAQERKRLVAAVRSVKAVVDVPLSVDTQRASVAEAALEAGADIVNDVSGLRADPAMGKVARRAGGVVLMASEVEPTHGEAVAMIARLLRQCLQRAVTARLSRRRIVLDPGIGFFRRAALPWHELDCAVIRDLGRLRRLGAPLLVGISRKSFLGRITGRKDPADRLYGSLAAAAIAVLAVWVYVVAAPTELPSPVPLARVVEVYPPPPPPPPPPPRVIKRESWTIVIHPAPAPSR